MGCYNAASVSALVIYTYADVAQRARDRQCRFNSCHQHNRRELYRGRKRYCDTPSQSVAGSSTPKKAQLVGQKSVISLRITQKMRGTTNDTMQKTI